MHIKHKRLFAISPRRLKFLGTFLTLAILLFIIIRVLAASIISVTPNTGPSTGGTNVIITGTGFTDYTPSVPINFPYTGSCQPYTVPANGSYQLETWGAQGGTAGPFAGGRGGYSTGIVSLTAGTTLYICVGGQGTTSSRTTSAPWPGGFNGGGGSARSNNGNGKATGSGGGGTDIRIGANSLFARVIVAGGGGGAADQQFGAIPGAAGGGLSGITSPNPGVVGSDSPGQGGTQTAGGNNGIACSGGGSFGAGGIPCGIGVTDRSGGGGGWFGGGTGVTGGGGSGFVYTQASDVSSATIGGTYLLNGSYYLSSAQTIDGATSAPSSTVPGGNQAGQLGNGFARITRLPYDVTIDGAGCDNIVIVNDNQITCTVPAHSAGPADVVVTIDQSVSTLTNGYTYTDELTISGPDKIVSRSGAEYDISLEYPYTGTVTLDDGGLGGTWTGPNVINGNQIQFNHNALIHVIYVPPTGFGGDITLTANSGVSYVEDASKDVSLAAGSYLLTCFDDESNPTSQPFIIPGTTLDCEVTLDGPYEGTITLADIVSGTGNSRLGGAFASLDMRFDNDVFTTTFADTDDESGQTLAFTYTSPTWGQIMGEDGGYTGITYDSLDPANRQNVFWPTLTATSSPVLTSSQNAIRIGLLAQAYTIESTDTPAIDAPGSNGCLNCRARFTISTYGAPYFGEITVTSEYIPAGETTPVTGGGLFDDGQTSVTYPFFGDGARRPFAFTPSEIGEFTITGVSDLPAIADDEITFDVLNSHISIVCDPIYLTRGQTTDCTLRLIVTDSDVPGIEIDMQDIFMYGSIENNGNGVFNDTSNDSGNPTSTLSGNVFSFCGGSSNPQTTGESCDDPSETYIRTFTYTLPIDTDFHFAEVRIQGSSEDYIPAETSWQILGIMPDTMTISCTEAYPTCQTSRVGFNQLLNIEPNGKFVGKVQLSDDDGGVFGGSGSGDIIEWDYSGYSKDFDYAPVSPGIKTITATVIEVDDSLPIGIQVGDEYTFEVTVYANEMTIFGPDFVALDDIWDYYRFGLSLNGPYEGTVTFSLWQINGAIETPLLPDSFPMTGDNIIDNEDGTYSCAVTLAMYDEPTNTTTACMADNGGVGTEFEGFNYFEIRATSGSYIPDVDKTVGIIAGTVYDLSSGWPPDMVHAGYDVLYDGTDATTDTIVVTIGTPVNFVMQPNALFAGTYSVDISGATGAASPDTVAVTASEWPATNDQTLQTRNLVFTPTATGYMTLTFDAHRDGTSAPNDPQDFGTKTVELLVLANTASITGPSSVTHGSDDLFTLIVDGPFIGTFYIDESITPSHLSPSSCTFDLNDYDEPSNTTSCVFDLASYFDDEYANFVEVFAVSGSISATKTVDIIADGYSVTNSYTTDPTETYFNAKINNPIIFTITPNAKHEGEFIISQSPVSGTLIGSPIAYTFDEFADLDQRTPLPKTFTYTPTKFGTVVLTIDTDLGPQDITLNIFDWPVIGGPDTIVKGQTSGEYTLSVMGAFDGPIDLTIWDAITETQITTATIISNTNGRIDDTNNNCDFAPSDIDSETGITTCTFTFELPPSFTGNYIEIHSDDPNVAISGLVADAHGVAVIANDFAVTPSSVLNATINQPLTFTITPNALYDGTFTLHAPAGGPFSEPSISFTPADWPDDQSAMDGKEFTYTPQHHGQNNIEVCSTDLGCQTINILVLADDMSITGSSAIQLNNTSMTGSYTLTIPGPYEGTVEFTVTDNATGAPISPLLFSNDGYCTFTTDDFEDITPGSTVCSFTVDFPAPLTPTKWVKITATTADGDKELTTANTLTAITANDYALSPSTSQTVTVGQYVTFTITPNAIATSSFGISTNGASTLSTAAVGFAMIDYPNTSNADVSKTFRVTTTTPGIETITVTSPLGTKTIQITTLASEIGITGPDRIKQGTTSSPFTLTINGPYDGTATISTYLPVAGGSTSTPVPGITTSISSCTFDIATHYNAVTNTTSCSFTVSVPLAYALANYVGITASAPGLTGDPIVAITADSFTLAPTPTTTGQVGTPITFTITPNGLFEGTFNLSDGGAGGTFSPTSMVYNSSSWPAVTDHTLPTGRTFTYTPAVPGIVTITVSDADATAAGIGNQQTIITVMANGGVFAGGTMIEPGDSDTYTLTVNGPYVGDVNLDLYRPGGGGTDLTDAGTFSNSGVCSFTLATYNSVANTTTCTFTVTFPDEGDLMDAFGGTNWIRIRASGATGVLIPPLTIGVTATSFDVELETDPPVVGEPITFNITPNGLSEETFIVTDENGIEVDRVTFVPGDWPASPDQSRYSRPFQFTSDRGGNRELTVCNTDTDVCETIRFTVLDEAPDPPDTGFFSTGEASFVVASTSGLLIAGVSTFLFLARRRRRQK
ncbi:glycine-rich protein [Candidatus Saccharibacteria bacterium]|nr:glycine-rich protein [Candidatus Saccharibacteria bacterium]